MELQHGTLASASNSSKRRSTCRHHAAQVLLSTSTVQKAPAQAVKGRIALLLVPLDTVQQEGLHLQGKHISTCSAQHEGLQPPCTLQHWCTAPAAVTHAQCKIEGAQPDERLLTAGTKCLR